MRIKRKVNRFVDRGAPAPVSGSDKSALDIGATSFERSDRNMKATAGGFQNTSMSSMPIEIDIDPLLKDIVFSEDLEQKRLIERIYKDIYYNDPIGGSTVDLTAAMTFSDFNLGGISDPKASEIFKETLDRLNVRTLLPDASIDYQVTGAFVGSMPYSEARNTFVDIIPYQHANCKIDPLPFYSQDPIITTAMPESFKQIMKSDSPRVSKLREYLGENISSQLTQDALELDPLSTLYIPRKTFSTSAGVSYYRRILPIWLLEKNLFRGTLVESARRQRGILHLTLGDGDQWEPTLSEMQVAMDLFQNADADPLGAVIATRMGISTDEIRQGGDFWKVTDLWDQTSQAKLRALMVSEAFLSGEASFSTGDTGLTVFIEYLRQYRDVMTYRMFYNKIFPLVSALNGFTVNRHGKLVKKGNLLSQVDIMRNHETLQDGSKLLIPSVHWSKSLKPEGDGSYMDMLQQLSEKGIPVPMRAMAAAGGFNLEQLLAGQEDDFRLIERVGKYRTKIEALKSQYMPKSGEEGGDSMGLAGVSDNTIKELTYELARNEMARESKTRSNVLSDNNGAMVGLANRTFPEHMHEVSGQEHSGKRRWLYDQKLADERANRKIAKQLEEIERKGNTHMSRSYVTPKKVKL